MTFDYTSADIPALEAEYQGLVAETVEAMNARSAAKDKVQQRQHGRRAAGLRLMAGACLDIINEISRRNR